MANYLNSGKVTMFPSAFRGSGEDKESYLTTEGNLTALAISSSDLPSFVKEDGDELTIYLRGYRFVVDKNDVRTAIASGNVWASIKLGTEGYTHLARYDTTASNILDDNGEFKGLYFSSAEETGADASIQILDENDDVPASSKFKMNVSSIQQNINSIGINSIDNEFATTDLHATTLHLDTMTSKDDDTDYIKFDKELKSVDGAIVRANLAGNATSATTVNIRTLDNDNDDKVRFKVGDGTEYNHTINNVAHATSALELDNMPSLSASGQSITVTAGGKTSSVFTVPYATTAREFSSSKTIGLTGDVTGSTSTTFSGETSIATTLSDDAVKESKIANGAVTESKINDDAVITSKIKDANVTTDKLKDGAVTTAKIANANVTTAKIADANVTTVKINDGAVTTAKLGSSAVTTAKINNGAVTNDKIATNANISGFKIAIAGTDLGVVKKGAPSGDRIYGVDIGTDGAMTVNVPWIAGKTYTATSPLSISSSDVISISSTPTFTSVEASYFVATSDERLKENIEEWHANKSILDLDVKQFDMKKDGSHHIGCIAQELQEICPEIVHENEDGYLSIEESKLVYLLLDEVKKLRKEVDELKEVVGHGKQ